MSNPVVICCDHAVPILSQRGIIPDAVFAVDGSGYIWNHFEGVPLIAALTCDPSMVYAWKGPTHFFMPSEEAMLNVVGKAADDVECLIDVGRTVGCGLFSYVMSELNPSFIEAHGFDYCWINKEKQHALQLTFTNMDIPARGIITGKASNGTDVRSYLGFVLDALLLKCRIGSWVNELGRQVNMYGTTIVPSVEIDWTKQLNMDLKESEKVVFEATMAHFGERWRGAARANSLHPEKGNFKEFTEKLCERAKVDGVILVAAGPSAEQSIGVNNGSPS